MDDERPMWRIADMDLEGSWGWSDLSGEVWGSIRDILASLETMTWNELQVNRRRAKGIPLEHLCGKAQKRLVQLSRDDIDELWELHIGGRERIWGIRFGALLSIVWWDPEHEVCPSQKRHT